MELLIINNFKIGNTKCKILEIAEEQYSYLLLNNEKLFKVYMVNCKMVLMVPYWGYFTGWGDTFNVRGITDEITI